MPRVLLALFLIVLTAAASDSEARRLALVVGSDDYRNVSPLKNARSDAKAVAKALEAAGFDVTLKTDLGKDALKAVIRTFKSRVQGGDDAVFYFSGHGVQLGAANYLLPVDIDGENEDQIRDDALPLQRVLDDLQDQKARFTLAIVDACRNNPFKGKGRDIGGRGLVPVNPATGQMVLYSAGAGQQALDRLGNNDRDPNGVFTRVLVKEMNQPGASVDQVLRDVRDQVVMLTRGVGHDQVPALYDQAIGKFYFVPGETAVPSQPKQVRLRQQPVEEVPAEDSGESVYWSMVSQANDATSYQAYLKEYPNGMHVADANEWLERDRQAQVARAKLKEDQAWKQAQAGNTWASFGSYLKAYPEGRYAKLARLKQSQMRPASQAFEPEMVAIPGKDYEMGKTHVTVEQFAAFVSDTGHDAGNSCWTYEGNDWKERSGRNWRNPGFNQGDQSPVVCINWNDAQAYVEWLSKKSGKSYRLPTDNEWKYACDGGQEHQYCGGDDLDGLGWYDKNSGNHTHRVGQKRANGYGLYDMSGNAWEWMQDCWEGDCSRRVLRGGSWYVSSEGTRAANRDRSAPSRRDDDLGFRVARSARTN